MDETQQPEGDRRQTREFSHTAEAKSDNSTSETMPKASERRSRQPTSKSVHSVFPVVIPSNGHRLSTI